MIAKVWSVAHGSMSIVTAIVASGAVASLLGALLAGFPLLGAVPIIFASPMLAEAIRDGDNLKGPALETGAAEVVALILAPLGWLMVGMLFVTVPCVLSLMTVVSRAWLAKPHRRLP